MATFKNSTFGRIRKGLGDDVCYRLGDQNILRKKPAFVRDAKTPKQLAQRAKMAEAVAVFRQVGSAIKGNFPQRSVRHSAFNAFTQKALSDAIEVVGEEATVNLAALQIASGSMPTVSNAVVAEKAAGTYQVTADNEIDNNSLFPNDKLVLTAIAVDGTGSPATTDNEIDGGATATIQLTDVGASKEYAFYAHFVSENGAKCSDSRYIGQVYSAAV